jgi:hypothetical protein
MRMQISSLLGFSVSAALLAACASIGAPNPAEQIAGRHGFGPNGILTPHASTIHGWIVPERERPPPYLYVADNGDGIIDIYALPKYSLAGQITDGISEPEGITTDIAGNLYAANLGDDTVTVYKKGTTTPSLTLIEPNGPDDVVVVQEGTVANWVAVGDIGGGVDLYTPGRTRVGRRLTNGAIFEVFGVGVDTQNNIYAAGLGSGSKPVVIEYPYDYEPSNTWEEGINLNLSGMDIPSGVLVDKSGNIVESDYGLGAINIYAPGRTSPTSTIAVPQPERSSLNRLNARIFVPQGSDDTVAVRHYPAGRPVHNITIGNFVSGTAMIPAPKP